MTDYEQMTETPKENTVIQIQLIQDKKNRF